MFRRGERPLRGHLREVAKPSRGRGFLRTDLEATPDCSDQGGYVNFTTRYGCRRYNFLYTLIHAKRFA